MKNLNQIIFLFAIFLLLQTVNTAAQAKAGAGTGEKKCPGHFGGPVANLCPSHFPDATSKKIWLVKFYAPWCGHCNQMKGKYIELGKFFKGNEEIGIGGVDCTAQENQALCQKYGVQGYPTIKAIVNGKAKPYEQARETEPMKQFMLNLLKNKGTSGGSQKCPKGLFKSGVTDSVISLCSEHFPDNKSKNSWLITFYQQKDQKIKQILNTIANDFGNKPAEKVQSKNSQQTQKELLEKISQKHNIPLNLRPKGHTATTPLIKVGGVCCDCDEAQTKFCQSKNISQFPTYQIYNNGKYNNLEQGVSEEQIFKEVLKTLKLVDIKSDL